MQIRKKFSQKQEKSFIEDGYLVVKNLISKNQIKKIQKTIINRSKNYLDTSKIFKNFYDKSFHAGLISLKRNKPERFGSFYDSLQKSLELYSIILNKKILSKVSKLSKLELGNLSFNGENIRMDLPHDKLHHVDWHQDRSYYFQNRDGNKGLVCWIPLMNMKKNLGPLKICKKSHIDGFVGNYKKSRKKNSSTQRKITINKKYKIINKPVEEGDVLFLSKNTIHASGNNISNFLRFSLQVRIHDLMDQNYLSFRHKIVYNESDIKIMKAKGINISDIEKISV